MRELEVITGLVLAAIILAAVARRVGAPYPCFLALGGAVLAFVPGAPSFTILPSSRWRSSWRRSCSTRRTTRRRAT